MHTVSKHQTFLIERRRQDVRDQAKEMSEALSTYCLILILILFLLSPEL